MNQQLNLSKPFQSGLVNIGLFLVDSEHSMKKTCIKLKKAFLKDLGYQPQIEKLFTHLSDVYFFAKNIEGQFVMANLGFARQCGAKSERELIGKTDLDFFPTDLAIIYAQDDQKVISSGDSIINRSELFVDNNGILNWFSTTKVPLLDKNGRIIGVAGTTHKLHQANQSIQPYKQLAKVVQHIRENYSKQIPVSDLAAIVNQSVSQFQRRFKSVFHITPLHYINRIRINVACRQLRESNDTISTIAQRCGFYDHSYFTKQFVKQIGMRPKKYRTDHI